MSAFFKNLGKKIGQLADLINGNDTEDEAVVSEKSPTTTEANVKNAKTDNAGLQPETESSPGQDSKSQPQAEPEVKQDAKTGAKPAVMEQPKKQPTERELFDNAIDKRNRAIYYLKEEFKSATGSTSSALASLYVYIIVDSEDYDVKKYAWADDTMKSQLRLELDNAMLDGIGRRCLEIRLVTIDNLPERAKEVIPDTLYYSFLAAPRKQGRARGRITVVEGTGSLARNEYILDSEIKQVYHIGRGPMANKPGAYRANDIVVRDNDPDTDLQQRNNHVSSAHADIIASNGRFFLKALKWGCRPMGGACTKLIYDDTDHEIRDTIMRHPLNDGYVIELGKQVVLMYENLSETE